MFNPMLIRQTIVVHVTETDIREGRRANCFECPVALAATRVLGTPYVARATYANVQVFFKGWGTILPVIAFARTPQLLAEFMQDFDNDEKEHLEFSAALTFYLSSGEMTNAS